MYEKITLPNGVRIVAERMDGVRSVSVGVWVGAGSRYEARGEAGSAHYIEHMLFKGTETRTAARLAEEMDAAGGQINAYTTRDSTCFYARVLDTQLPLAIDVLTDMFFHSRFAPEDVENERGIILEEIDMYEDTPEDVAAERLLAGCFKGALGRPVLGTKRALEAQTGASLRDFMARHYIAPRLVVALAGSFTDADLRLLAERFGGVPPAEDRAPAPAAYTPCFTVRRKSVEQTQLVLGFPGLPTDSPDRFALQLFSGILGGNASSRLFQTVRERHGLCYSIYSFTAGFADTGLFAVATAMNRDSEARALALIADELRRLRERGVTAGELDRARRQATASILMSLESTASRMNRLGFGALFLGGTLPAEELIARYEAVTREEILALARRILAPEGLAVSAVGRDAREEKYRELFASLNV